MRDDEFYRRTLQRRIEELERRLSTLKSVPQLGSAPDDYLFGKIVNGGHIPTAGGFYYLINPGAITGPVDEGLSGTVTYDSTSQIGTLVLGSSAPSVGDIVIGSAVRYGRWVAMSRGGCVAGEGQVCYPACCPKPLPNTATTGDSNGSVTLTSTGTLTGWTATKTVTLPSSPSGQNGGVIIPDPTPGSSGEKCAPADQHTIPVTYTLICNGSVWTLSVTFPVLDCSRISISTFCDYCIAGGTWFGVNYGLTATCATATVSGTCPIDCDPDMLSFTLPTSVRFPSGCTIPVPGGGGAMTVVF